MFISCPRELNQDLICNMCIFVNLTEDWLRKNGFSICFRDSVEFDRVEGTEPR